VRRSRTSWLVLALSAAVLAGPLMDDAVAKKPKARFSARVDGKRVKALKRAIVLLYSTTSFSVNGATNVRRGVVRTVTANCLGNLKTLVLPATLSCYGTYTEARRTGAKDWARNDGMAVTVESFDGSRAVGTFHGTLDPGPSHAGDPPVTVESGSFSIVLTDVGV
jgi:hypothetical protein